MRPTARLLFVASASAALLAAPLSVAAAGDDAPRIYRWVDTDGIAHYTTDLTRVPTSLRARAAAAAAPEASAPRSRRPADVWAERDRPPEASEAEALEDDGFGVDDPARQARVADIDGQIEGLLEEIAVDEETLKQRVVGPDVNPLAGGRDEDMRTAAARLPKLLATLRTLREERAALEAR